MCARNTDLFCDLLKIVLSFSVVCCHFYNTENETLLLLLSTAVPCFIILSFYFTGSHIHTPDISYLKNRISRLMIPFEIFGAGYGLILYFLQKVSAKEVCYQALFGSAYQINPPLYYLFIISIITILFFIFNKPYYMCLFITLSFIMQFSKLNFYMFCELPYEMRYSFGRIFEFLPYACAGYLLYFFYKKTFSILPKIIFSISLLSLFFILSSLQFLQVTHDFGYSGLSRFFLSLCIISVIFLIQNIFPVSSNNSIHIIARLTFPTYCSHMILGRLFTKYFTFLPIINCICIYTISMLFSFILYNINHIIKNYNNKQNS